MLPCLRLLAFVLATVAGAAQAQGAGGLYIAGGDFGLAAALDQALANNPRPAGRFFVLVLPSAQPAAGDAAALALLAKARARGGEILACRRDVAAGNLIPTRLGSPVAEVRGWPPFEGGTQMLPGTDFYPGESPATLPAAHGLLRRLRSACS